MICQLVKCVTVSGFMLGLIILCHTFVFCVFVVPLPCKRLVSTGGPESHYCQNVSNQINNRLKQTLAGTALNV